MKELDDDTRQRLRSMQRREKDKRRYVKITVLLMLDAGFSVEQTALALGIDGATVYRYIEHYDNSALLGAARRCSALLGAARRLSPRPLHPLPGKADSPAV